MSDTSRKDVLVTVIVPAYEVETFVDACVSSVVAQTYPHLDVIVVNDGSTDRTPQICDEWSRRDSRVRAIHTANGGLSMARNRGLDLTLGDFVTFVDGDDVLAPDYVEHLVDVARSTGADMVSTSVVRFGDEEPVFREASDIRTHTSDEALREIVRTGLGFSSCGKLVAAEAFGRVRFRPGAAFEDLEILPRLMVGIEQVAVSDAALYGYRQRQGSIMAGHRQRLPISLVSILSDNISFARRSGAAPVVVTDLSVGYVLHGLRVLEDAGRRGTAREAGFDRAFRRLVMSQLGPIMRSKDLNPVYKVGVLLAVASPGCFARLAARAHRAKATSLPFLRRGR